MINSVIDSGVNGLQRSSQALNNAAQEIASAATPRSDSSTQRDLIEPVVELNVQQQLFDASARVVEVGNDSLGALLDIKA